MTVSVRMNPLLEKELDSAARRLGVTKSQFIISAVERALGLTDPAALYQKVMEEAADYAVSDPPPDPVQADEEIAVKRHLRADHQRQQDDFAAHLQSRSSPHKSQL